MSENIRKFNLKNYRETKQYLAPVHPPKLSEGEYNIYPAYPIPDGKIFDDLEPLSEIIISRKNIVIDGYAGVFWEDLRNQLSSFFVNKNIEVNWTPSEIFMLAEEDIFSKVFPFLGGDDPVFGRRYTGDLSDFFDHEELSEYRPDDEKVNIVYGVGAALIKSNWPIIYVDLPKNELQFRMRAGTALNIGTTQVINKQQSYKRFYFVDCVVLNHHKAKILPKIEIFIDGQRPDELIWMEGEAFRTVLKEISENGFRPRPWFEPGAWGGQWIKKNIPLLNPDVPNYAWSFELITPENGIMISSDDKLLEFSFDFLMVAAGKNILGDAYERFGIEFPIRFDFLDTFDGGNLSVQCHPRPDYIKEQFGENFTQDETYYILDAEENAKCYLGFQEDIDPVLFREALENSQKNGVAVDIPKFVQVHDSHKHDLFLIPNGTIHGSGKNNMVLEISSTPYIFTFKMYDWLRMDLDGKPRPINIEHAFQNLYFDRKGKKVIDELISKPHTIEKTDSYEILHLPTHQDHFYDVHRLEFDNKIEIATQNKCHVLMLVEGNSMTFISEKGKELRFNYAETIVVPAATNYYTLINHSEKRAKVVKAFVK
ncbi:MAG: class I mannose-6-phosphate isomerase [Candidatus Marinimicrobia bacterium]|nr:class I mannose-6-phosphate isomerase [Candidatus Neomarinimicrobiota bacterium]